jgi:hypothetical protein
MRWELAVLVCAACGGNPRHGETAAPHGWSCFEDPNAGIKSNCYATVTACNSEQASYRETVAPYEDVAGVTACAAREVAFCFTYVEHTQNSKPHETVCMETIDDCEGLQDFHEHPTDPSTGADEIFARCAETR